jgi:hypothetical protein
MAMNWKRGLFRLWLVLSLLWGGGVLAIAGQCMYGQWIGRQQLWCEGELVNPVATYIADVLLLRR